MSAQQLPSATRMRWRILTNTTSSRVLLLLLAAGLAGCSDANSPSAPTTPSPVPQAERLPERMEARLQGAVSDTAFRPLAGAKIEIVAGPGAGAWTYADAGGGFSFRGNFDPTTQVRAGLNGYVDATLTLSRCVYCPDYYAYFYLAVPVPPVSIAGDYALTFIADSACTDLPDEVRTRSYTATLTASRICPIRPIQCST